MPLIEQHTVIWLVEREQNVHIYLNSICICTHSVYRIRNGLIDTNNDKITIYYIKQGVECDQAGQKCIQIGGGGGLISVG